MIHTSFFLIYIPHAKIWVTIRALVRPYYTSANGRSAAYIEGARHACSGVSSARALTSCTGGRKHRRPATHLPRKSNHPRVTSSWAHTTYGSHETFPLNGAVHNPVPHSLYSVPAHKGLRNIRSHPNTNFVYISFAHLTRQIRQSNKELST
jgi:hypothetical protein